MKKDTKVREKKWVRQQKIREEFLEANFKRKEQQWERAKFEAKRRRMERRDGHKGKRTVRKNEGWFGSLLQQSIQQRCIITNNSKKKRS